MQTKLMTESEWRKKVYPISRKQPGWWGPQCVYPSARRRRVLHDRSFHRFILMLSVITAFLLPFFYASSTQEIVIEPIADQQQSMQVRHVSAISYNKPVGLANRICTFTREELLRGRMMLLDEEHRLPSDIAPPNTASVAKYGKGMVPVRSFSVKTGEQTIEALSLLFSQMKAEGMEGIYVWQGALTEAQQRQSLSTEIRSEIRNSSSSRWEIYTMLVPSLRSLRSSSKSLGGMPLLFIRLKRAASQLEATIMQ